MTDMYEIRKKTGLVVKVADGLSILVGRPVEDALDREYDLPRIGQAIKMLETGSRWTEDVPTEVEIVGLVCEIESIEESYEDDR